MVVSRPSENEVRREYAEEWRYYYSSAAGNADLGRLQAQFDGYYQALEDYGVRVTYLEPAGAGDRSLRLDQEPGDAGRRRACRARRRDPAPLRPRFVAARGAR